MSVWTRRKARLGRGDMERTTGIPKVASTIEKMMSLAIASLRPRLSSGAIDTGRSPDAGGARKAKGHGVADGDDVHCLDGADAHVSIELIGANDELCRGDDANASRFRIGGEPSNARVE